MDIISDEEKKSKSFFQFFEKNLEK